MQNKTKIEVGDVLLHTGNVRRSDETMSIQAVKVMERKGDWVQVALVGIEDGSIVSTGAWTRRKVRSLGNRECFRHPLYCEEMCIRLYSDRPFNMEWNCKPSGQDRVSLAAYRKWTR